MPCTYLFSCALEIRRLRLHGKYMEFQNMTLSLREILMPWYIIAISEEAPFVKSDGWRHECQRRATPSISTLEDSEGLFSKARPLDPHDSALSSNLQIMGRP